MAGFLGTGQRDKRWDEGIDWHSIDENGTWETIRFVGDLYFYACHWLTTKSNKNFPMMCSDYNHETREFERGTCEICSTFKFKDYPKESRISKLYPRQAAYGHIIDRGIQEMGAPTKNDGKWTFLKPLRIPMSVVFAVGKQAELNVHKIDGVKVVKDVTDNEYGCDIRISYDKNEKDPTKKYTVNMGSHAPLTDEELEHYARFSYAFEKMVKMPSREEQKKALKMNGYYEEAGIAEASQEKSDAGIGTMDSDAPPRPEAKQTQKVETAPAAPAPEPETKSVADTVMAPPAEGTSYDPSVTFQLPMEPDPVPADVMQSMMTKFASDNGLKTQVYTGEGTPFKGFSMPSCFADYSGKRHCFTCKARKECTMLGE